MSRYTHTTLAAVLSMLLGLLAGGGVRAADIRVAGSRVELSVASVSERTVRIVLAPLDDAGRLRRGAASSVLVPLEPQILLAVRALEDTREVIAGKLRVRVKPAPLTITVSGPSDKVVQELVVADDGSMSFRTPAPVLGLGEGLHQFDRRGHEYPMRNGQLSPFLRTHGGTIPVPFLIGTDGWAMFVHRPWGRYDLRGGKGKLIPQADLLGREPWDVFITALDQPTDAPVEFIRLTGRPAMPPKWALGYMQSHRTLYEPEEPLEVARTFRDKRLPCDVLIYLGTGYTNRDGVGWNMGHGSLEFNPRSFPHPRETLQALHDLNFKVILHKNAAPRNLFGNSVTEKSDNPVHIGNYWASHRAVNTLIDGWWPDDGDELPIEARLARHLAYYEGSLLERPDERPWSLHRNGYAGAARYGGWIWSGDPHSLWATLAAHVPVGLNHGLSLTPFWSSDTGGFVATRELTGELYVRWFQFSTFCALFRAHGRNWHLHLPWGWDTGDAGPIESPVTRPADMELHNGAVEPICRTYLELRYRLLPYNYTLLREAHDSGLPLMRALWLHYPDDPEAVKLGSEYLWGRDLLIAPVTEKGAVSRRLYLPGATWYDWWTAKAVPGKQWIERPVDLGTLPIYVRAGAIIPLDPVRQYTSQPTAEPTTLRVYPGADGTFTLYDDDGRSLGYQNGSDAKTVWLRFRWDDRSRRLTVERDTRMRKWTGGTRVFVVEVVGSDSAPKRIEFRGQAALVAF
jgi:alpha-glucosidase/alpha-D-xyloside xylohydrolase